ncbi:hypothetical protein KAH37_03835 [bacterium]|nr:hypothetical protein [bacterium]
MKKGVLLFFTFLLFSCNCSPSQPSTDYDNDSDTQLSTDRDSDLSTHHDSDATTDTDYDSPITDSNNDIATDADIHEQCLDLRIQQNVIKSGFPLKDKNGKITFCRPECDTPTETDPQCVRNIWDWNNWGVYQTYLNDEEKKTSPECYPWPCIITEMKASHTNMKSSCDRFLAVNNYGSSMGTISDLRVSEGIAGIEMGGYVSGYNSLRAMAYHIEKDAFEPVGYSGAYTGFNYGRFLLTTANGDWSKETFTQTYIISAKRMSENHWKYEVIYDDEQRKSYCPTVSPWTNSVMYEMGFGSFDGQYQL